MVKQHTNSLDIWQRSQKVHNIGYLQNVQHWHPENKHLLSHYKNFEIAVAGTCDWYKGFHGYSAVSAAWLDGISCVLWPVQVARAPTVQCVCVSKVMSWEEWTDDEYIKVKRDDEQQTGQNHHNKARLSPSRISLFSQLIKVHNNTKTTSQDLHLLIHRYRIDRIQAFSG